MSHRSTRSPDCSVFQGVLVAGQDLRELWYQGVDGGVDGLVHGRTMTPGRGMSTAPRPGSRAQARERRQVAPNWSLSLGVARAILGQRLAPEGGAHCAKSLILLVGPE